MSEDEVQERAEASPPAQAAWGKMRDPAVRWGPLRQPGIFGVMPPTRLSSLPAAPPWSPALPPGPSLAAWGLAAAVAAPRGPRARTLLPTPPRGNGPGWGVGWHFASAARGQAGGGGLSCRGRVSSCGFLRAVFTSGVPPCESPSPPGSHCAGAPRASLCQGTGVTGTSQPCWVRDVRQHRLRCHLPRGDGGHRI